MTLDTVFRIYSMTKPIVSIAIMIWIDPQENLVAIYMMQAPEQRNQYRQLFRNLVYAALEC
jgi:CubicO group peptidase (beta-lactamase class C family)